MSNKRLFFISSVALLVSLVFSAAAFAGITKIPGVPDFTPFLVTLSLDAQHQSEITKIIDNFKKEKKIDKYLSEFKQRTGINFPDGLLESLKKLSGFTMAVFLNTSNLSDAPNVLLNASFASESDAAEFIKLIKNFIYEYEGAQKQANETGTNKIATKEIEFIEKTDAGIKFSIPVFKSDDKENTFKFFEPRFFTSGNMAGIFLFRKTNIAASEKIYQAALASFKKDDAIFSNKSFKANFSIIGEDANFFFYFDGATSKRGAIETGNADAADLISSISIAAKLSPNFKTVNSKWLIKTGNPKDKKAQSKTEFVKNIISSSSSSKHISEILPSDTAAFFDIKLNLNEKFLKFAKPFIDIEKPNIAMMFGITVEEDLLVWLTGEVFGAALTGAPAFYIGFGTKSAEKTWDFINKFEKILKIAGAPFAFQDDTCAGVKVKTSELKEMTKYIKDFKLTLGVAGDNFVLASSKSAFEKLVTVKKETSLSAAERFKSILNWKPESFVSLYMDYEQFKPALKESSGPNSSEFQLQPLNKFLKIYSNTASYSDNLVSGNAHVEIEPDEFILEAINILLNSAGVKEIVESLNVKTK